ncbi:hypothetical protein JTB14_028171 [Gonioctena quinquepunctata]|nr:hypothetical protein JTB14_028171 [Gonioctena quinquepunctata]
MALPPLDNIDIIKWFQASGVSPSKREIFTDVHYAPSIVTDLPSAVDNIENIPTLINESKKTQSAQSNIIIQQPRAISPQPSTSKVAFCLCPKPDPVKPQTPENVAKQQFQVILLRKVSYGKNKRRLK